MGLLAALLLDPDRALTVTHDLVPSVASAVGGGGRVEGRWGGGNISPAASLIIVGTLADHRPGPLRVFPSFPESAKPVGGWGASRESSRKSPSYFSSNNNPAAEPTIVFIAIVLYLCPDCNQIPNARI